MTVLVRRLILVLGILIGPMVLFHLEENARGRRAWEAWKGLQEAAGQSYDPAAYAPPEISDAKNFAEAPIANRGPEAKDCWQQDWDALVKPDLGDWRRGVATDFAPVEAERKGRSLEGWLSPFDAGLDQLAEAARRPASRLPQVIGQPGRFYAMLGRIGGLTQLMRAQQLRALARLHQGRAEAALEDVLTGLRVAQQLAPEPAILVQLARRAWMEMMLQPLWEGLAGQAWNEAQLVRLQTALEPVDLVGSLRRAWQSERCGAAILDRALRGFPPESEWPDSEPAWRRWSRRILLPKGWTWQALVMEDQAEAQVQAALDPLGHRVDAARVRAAEAGPAGGWRRSLERWVGWGGARRKASQVAPMARVQAAVDQARVACALERYRLARGSYPGRLEALVPAYLAQVPHDLVTGGAFHYALADKDYLGYLLHSAGWSGTDEEADWVWFSGLEPEHRQHESLP